MASGFLDVGDPEAVADGSARDGPFDGVLRSTQPAATALLTLRACSACRMLTAIVSSEEAFSRTRSMEAPPRDARITSGLPLVTMQIRPVNPKWRSSEAICVPTLPVS
jgi:hypothetical protein